MTDVFIEDDALEVRRTAVELLLKGTMDAVRLLREQVASNRLEPKDRRAAAVALLTFAGLATGVPKGAEGVPRPQGTDHLLAILNARQEEQRGYVHDGVGLDPFAPIPADYVPMHKRPGYKPPNGGNGHGSHS